MIDEELETNQRELCNKHNVEWVLAPAHLKVGIAQNVKSSLVPVNGLRLSPEGDTTGWYIWAGEGEPSADDDFFLPLHVEHVAVWRPEVLKFLGLPPGWRFLTDGKYEDVWEDADLLKS